MQTPLPNNFCPSWDGREKLDAVNISLTLVKQFAIQIVPSAVLHQHFLFKKKTETRKKAVGQGLEIKMNDCNSKVRAG